MSLMLTSGEDDGDLVLSNGGHPGDLVLTEQESAAIGEHHLVMTTANGQELIVVVTNGDGGIGVVNGEHELQHVQFIEHDGFQVPNIGGAVEIGDVVQVSLPEPVEEQSCSSPRPFQCSHCDYRAVRRDALNNHVAAVHEGKKPHACSQCQFRTTRKATLDRHVRKMHLNNEVRGLVCVLCGSKCGGGEDLKMHLRTHHSDVVQVKELVCALCGKKCLDSDDLKTHLFAQHPDVYGRTKPEANKSVVVNNIVPKLEVEDQIIINNCVTNQEAVVIEPTFVNVLENETVQEIAARKISQINEPLPVIQRDGKLIVIDNKATAEQVKEQGNFECTECGHRAVNQYKLTAHVKIVHEKRKPYVCETCDFRTVTVNKLNNHIAEVHHRQKPYACRWCDFRSARQYNLNVHMSQVHLGEKPFGCKLCDYRAARKDKIRRHLSVTHGHSAAEANEHISVEKGAKLTETNGISANSLDNNGATTAVIFQEEYEHGLENGNGEEEIDNNLPFIDLLPKEPVPLHQYHKPIVSNANTVFINLGQVPQAEAVVDVTTGSDSLNDEEIILTTEESPENTTETVVISNVTSGGPTQRKKKRTSSPAADLSWRKHVCQYCDYKAARSNTLKMHILAVHEQAKHFECKFCSYKTARRGDLNRHAKTVHKVESKTETVEVKAEVV